ncbi:MAG: polysaccharide biosynthesis C-terminal domain-containing protein [Erythrobacter sp.]
MLAELKAKFLGESDEGEVLRGAAIAFVLRGIGAVLAFALSVVVGRLLGAEGAGLYFLSLSIVTIASVVARFGLDNSLLRFIASAASLGEWARVKGVRRLAMGMGTIAGLLTAAAIIIFAHEIALHAFGQPQLGPVLRAMGAASFGLPLMMLNAESLKGLKRIAAAVCVSSIIFPSVALLTIYPLVAAMGPSGAAAAYGLGVLIAAAIGWLLWHFFMRGHAADVPKFAISELWASCRPLWVMAIVTKAVMPWAALLILGFFAAPADTGIYGAAARIAGLVTFILLTVNTAISPKFGELYAKGEIEQLGRIARRFALVVALIASPLLVLLIFAGGFVISMFGPEFVRGGTALAILALGQAFSALCGSAGSLLIMTGHVTQVRNAALVGGGLVVGLSVLLIPMYNLIGAAIATAVSIAIMNLIYVIQIKRALGFVVIPIWRAK